MDSRTPSLVRILAEELAGNLILSRTYYPAYARGLMLAGHEHVLEFGSGGGLLSRALAVILHPDGGLTCIDASKYWVDKAQRRLGNTPGIVLLCGDVTRADLPENHFDAVIVHFALHEVDRSERIGVVSALARALRPGGLFFVREPARPDHGMQPDEIHMLMQDA